MVLKRGSLQGMTYLPETATSNELSGCLLIVSYENGEIYRVTLSRSGETYATDAELFARVPGAVDVTYDAEGVIYVSCFQSRKIYRITERREDT